MSDKALSKSMDLFKVSKKTALESQNDLALRIAGIEEYIGRKSRDLMIGDLEIIRAIMSVTTDANILRKLGETLIKISPYIEDLKKHQESITLVNIYLKEPNRFALLLGDGFGEDIEEQWRQYVDDNKSE